MAGFGLLVLAEAVGKLIYGGAPLAGYMAGVGVLALAANTFCLVLLTRFRDDDVNMRSAWICSRNDLIANTGVLVAAGFVVATGSLLPDVIVGVAIALLFLHSSVGVLRDAYHSRVEARTARTAG
jgi:Co/Zn/Cd efflux system component